MIYCCLKRDFKIFMFFCGRFKNKFCTSESVSADKWLGRCWVEAVIEAEKSNVSFGESQFFYHSYIKIFYHERMIFRGRLEFSTSFFCSFFEGFANYGKIHSCVPDLDFFCLFILLFRFIWTFLRLATILSFEHK